MHTHTHKMSVHMSMYLHISICVYASRFWPTGGVCWHLLVLKINKSSFYISSSFSILPFYSFFPLFLIPFLWNKLPHSLSINVTKHYLPSQSALQIGLPAGTLAPTDCMCKFTQFHFFFSFFFLHNTFNIVAGRALRFLHTFCPLQVWADEEERLK